MRITTVLLLTVVLSGPDVSAAIMEDAPGGKALAWMRFEDAPETYAGTAYRWLGDRQIDLIVSVTPAAGHRLYLLWGAKNDTRSAEVVVNGESQTVEGGGYDGFRWMKVELSRDVSGDHYEISCRRTEGNAAFIAEVRLVDSTATSDAGDVTKSASHKTQMKAAVAGSVLPNIEVNGEQIQTLARIYTMTGEKKYLEYAERLADFYLLSGDFAPERLRDHGCEIIGGLGLLLGVESEHKPEKARQYLPLMKAMLDTVLEKGTNEDGIMYNRLGSSSSGLSDGWGYNYVAYLCYDMAVGKPVYQSRIEQTLRGLAKPKYRNFRWEGNSIDGYADSVEGGLYMLNRLPVEEGFTWADHEVAANIVYSNKPGHLWGTMKLQSNGVRTAIMHALMHTRGTVARPWRQGLKLGAVDTDGGIEILLKSDKPYEGELVFDIPRHRRHLGFTKDWPRMNTLPEWFTVEPDHTPYVVHKVSDESTQIVTGADLRDGLAVSVASDRLGSRLQRSLKIPIGIIDNARGGASIESLVPRHKFDDDPLPRRYADWVEQRRAEFDWDAALKPLLEKWKEAVAAQREKGVSEDQLPPRPTRESLRSWSVPGKSPSDAAACYNGMFGVFKGLQIKGVLFHQGYNNAIGSACRPKRYRVLMKLMVEGWREDFNDPTLPVGVIGFCAGGIPQTRENFEIWSVSSGAYIREAQRLGLADVEDPTNTAFLPAYDVQIPGLHPSKKVDHGVRAARWALKTVHGMKVDWDAAKLLSAERDGDRMVLTFDKKVMPDDMSTVIEGFSIADASGQYYMAHATLPLIKDVGIWNTANKSFDATKVIVWSPLVQEPVAVRYGWATSPMGNLKVNGKAWNPPHSFRTDEWDWPESEDPAEALVDRGKGREMNQEAAERNEFRRTEEAKRAVEILERLKTLGKSES